jgi:membrane-bound serine protease (ClpP class)
MLSTIVGLGAAGLVLIFLEMFLPGLIAGIVGACLLIASVVMAYGEFGAAGGNVALALSLAGSGALWWWWAYHFQNTRFGQSMTLKTSVDGKSVTADLPNYVGLEGTAVTTLRPSGTVLIGGKRVDAVSDGEFLESGTHVRVLKAHGITIVVRRVS